MMQVMKMIVSRNGPNSELACSGAFIVTLNLLGLFYSEL